MKRPPMELLALALAVPLLFPLQAQIDDNPGEEATVLTMLPPRRLISVLAVGHGTSAADLLEVRATNYLLSSLLPGGRLDRGQLLRFYQAIMELDPNDPDACVRGAMYLSSLADRPDAAISHLQEGVKRVPTEHPRRWLIFWELAATHLMAASSSPDEDSHHSAFREAGKVLIRLADLPGVEQADQFRDLGETLLRKGLSPFQALQQEVRFWEERAERGREPVRERARERLLEAKCGVLLHTLRRHAEKFEEARGRPPRALSELRVADPQDPLGVGYFLVEGQVIAPAFEARRLERQLLIRLQNWLLTHPGATPSLSDLGVGAVPPYLRMTLSQDSIQVEPAFGG